MDQNTKEVLLSFGGVIVGFALSECATFLRSRRETTSIGESFEFHIDALQSSLKVQLTKLKDYHSEVQEHKATAPIIAEGANQFFANVDRLRVVKYRSRTMSKSEAFRTMHNAMGAVHVAEAEMSRFKNQYENFLERKSTIVSRYVDVCNEFTQTVSEYVRQSRGIDEYANTVMGIILLTVGKPVDSILQHRDTLHKPIHILDNEGNNRTHVLHAPITKLLDKGGSDIDEMETVTSGYAEDIMYTISMLTQCRDQLKRRD